MNGSGTDRTSFTRSGPPLDALDGRQNHPTTGHEDHWQWVPPDDGEQSLEEVADWGPAEDWSDWANASQ